MEKYVYYDALRQEARVRTGDGGGSIDFYGGVAAPATLNEQSDDENAKDEDEAKVVVKAPKMPTFSAINGMAFSEARTIARQQAEYELEMSKLRKAESDGEEEGEASMLRKKKKGKDGGDAEDEEQDI